MRVFELQATVNRAADMKVHYTDKWGNSLNVENPVGHATSMTVQIVALKS